MRILKHPSSIGFSVISLLLISIYVPMTNVNAFPTDGKASLTALEFQDGSGTLESSLESIASLQQTVGEGIIDKSEAVNVLRSRYTQDGSFAEKFSNVGETYMATYLLKKLGLLTSADEITIIDFVRSAKHINEFGVWDGSFNWNPYMNDYGYDSSNSWMNDLSSTYYAVATLNLLGDLTASEKVVINSYISNRIDPVNEEWITPIFHAIRILNETGGLYSLGWSMSALANRVAFRQITNPADPGFGGFSPSFFDYFPDGRLGATSRAILILDVLGELALINQVEAVSYILSLQRDHNWNWDWGRIFSQEERDNVTLREEQNCYTFGGFVNRPGDDLPWDDSWIKFRTMQGLRALSTLGNLHQASPSNTTNYLLYFGEWHQWFGDRDGDRQNDEHDGLTYGYTIWDIWNTAKGLQTLGNFTLMNSTVITQYITSSRHMDGGWSEKTGNIVSTYLHLDALSKLDSLGTINQTKTVEFLTECPFSESVGYHNFTLGYGVDIGITRFADHPMRNEWFWYEYNPTHYSYFGLKSLELLGGINVLSNIEIEGLKNYTRYLAHQANGTPGFDAEGSPETIFVAIQLADILNISLDGFNLSDRLSSYETTQGGYTERYDVMATHYALDLLAHYGELGSVNTTQHLLWLLSENLQRKDWYQYNGTFGYDVTRFKETDYFNRWVDEGHDTTFFALAALNRLNGINLIDTNGDGPDQNDLLEVARFLTAGIDRWFIWDKKAYGELWDNWYTVKGLKMLGYNLTTPPPELVGNLDAFSMAEYVASLQVNATETDYGRYPVGSFALWREEDGKGDFPRWEDTRINSASQAVGLLQDLGYLSLIDQTALVDYIKNRQVLDDPTDGWNYGGFRSQDHWEVNMMDTFAALSVLSKLGKLDSIDQTAVIQWIKQHEITDMDGIPQGYFAIPSPSDYHVWGVNTWFQQSSYPEGSLGNWLAIKSLQILGQDIEPYRNGILWFTQKQEMKNGGFSSSFGDLRNTLYSIQALDTLGELQQVDITKVSEMIAQLQVTATMQDEQWALGTFQEFEGQYAQRFGWWAFRSTYQAVSTLDLLNQLGQMDIGLVFEYINNELAHRDSYYSLDYKSLVHAIQTVDILSLYPFQKVSIPPMVYSGDPLDISLDLSNVWGDSVTSATVSVSFTNADAASLPVNVTRNIPETDPGVYKTSLNTSGLEGTYFVEIMASHTNYSFQNMGFYVDIKLREMFIDIDPEFNTEPFIEDDVILNIKIRDSLWVSISGVTVSIDINNMHYVLTETTTPGLYQIQFPLAGFSPGVAYTIIISASNPGYVPISVSTSITPQVLSLITTIIASPTSVFRTKPLTAQFKVEDSAGNLISGASASIILDFISSSKALSNIAQVPDYDFFESSPGSYDFTMDTTGLSTGSYRLTVTISKSGYGDTTEIINFDLLDEREIAFNVDFPEEVVKGDEMSVTVTLTDFEDTLLSGATVLLTVDDGSVIEEMSMSETTSGIYKASVNTGSLSIGEHKLNIVAKRSDKLDSTISVSFKVTESDGPLPTTTTGTSELPSFSPGFEILFTLLGLLAFIGRRRFR